MHLLDKLDIGSVQQRFHLCSLLSLSSLSQLSYGEFSLIALIANNVVFLTIITLIDFIVVMIISLWIIVILIEGCLEKRPMIHKIDIVYEEFIGFYSFDNQ